MAPSLLTYEVAAVLRNKVHRGLMEDQDGREALELLMALPVSFLRPAGLHGRAYDLARELSLPTAYDAHYLALTEALDAELWTLDERFRDRAQNRHPGIRTVSAADST